MKRLLCLLLTMMFLLGTVSALADSVAQEVVPVEILISGSRPMNEYTEMTRQQVIDEVMASGIRGRGGAGFPSGRKWQFAYNVESVV